MTVSTHYTYSIFAFGKKYFAILYSDARPIPIKTGRPVGYIGSP